MNLPLTADLCAKAITAAARAYGDDPIQAVTTSRGILRRSLAPAAIAVSRATGLQQARVCRVLNLNENNVITARRKANDGYTHALTQALLSLGGAALANAPERPAEPPAAAELELDGEFTVVDPPPAALAPPRMPGPAAHPEQLASTPGRPATPPAAKPVRQSHEERMAMIRAAGRKTGLLKPRPGLIRSRTRADDQDEPEVRDLVETFR